MDINVDPRLILFKKPTIIIYSITYFLNQAVNHYSLTDKNKIKNIFKQSLLFLIVHITNNKYRKKLLSWKFDKTTTWKFILSQL